MPTTTKVTTGSPFTELIALIAQLARRADEEHAYRQAFGYFLGEPRDLTPFITLCDTLGLQCFRAVSLTDREEQKTELRAAWTQTHRWLRDPLHTEYVGHAQRLLDRIERIGKTL